MDRQDPADGAEDRRGGEPPLDAGEEAARYYNRVWERAFDIALSSVGRHSASDVAQHVAMGFVHHLRAGRIRRTDEEGVDAWATGATRLRLLAINRAVGRREALEVDYDADGLDAQVQVPPPSEFYHARELAEVIRRVLVALPARQRDIFLAVREEGKAYDLIAREKDIKEVTARWHYCTAVQRLSVAVRAYMTEGLIPEIR